MVTRDGLTIIMVTHDRDLAAQFADRTIFMKDGEVRMNAERGTMKSGTEEINSFRTSSFIVPRSSFKTMVRAIRLISMA
ncbi:MAG: hypothetical protein WKF30_18460 [Pyrinomonadaceae bacterium]